MDLVDLHTLFGALVFGIPLGMLMLALGLLLRRPLTALMTERARWIEQQVGQLGGPAYLQSHQPPRDVRPARRR